MDIDSWDLYKWIRNIRDKKVIIVGSDHRAEKLFYKLVLLDIKVDYFVDDIIEKGELCGCDVCNYYELLYEL